MIQTDFCQNENGFGPKLTGSWEYSAKSNKFAIVGQ